MSHTLIVLPDDTAKPILDAINGAKQSLNIRMFLFTDPTLLNAVIAAKQRGVKVRVMLNPARRNGETENDGSAQDARSPPASRCATAIPTFALTHQKSMVIDDATGFVESLNWEPSDLTETRDYAVVTDARSSKSREMVAVLRRRLGAQDVPRRIPSRGSSGARTTAASASRRSSTRRRTRCGCRTSATRTR